MVDRRPLEQIVAEHVGDHPSPSVAWGVVVDGALVVSGGHRSPDDHTDVPVDEHTVYRIASMTKSFSAAATLLLRDEGVLGLDDHVTSHAPELGALRAPTEDAAPITIRDLLSMTSGLVSDDEWADRHLDLSDDEFDRIVHRGTVFAHPTGTDYEYSNFGYAVLGRVVHRATGRRLQDIITDRLLAPLGMHDTTWVQPSQRAWRRPQRRIDDRFEDELPTPGDGVIAPMGGLWTNVADLARWLAFMDDAFPARDGDDDGPLRRSSRREMQSAQHATGETNIRGVSTRSSYGYGLRVIDDPGLGRVVSHSGGLPGYGSSMSWLPGRRVGVVALGDVTYARMSPLVFRLLDELRSQGVVPDTHHPMPPDLELAAALLIDLLGNWDDDAATALFADNVAADEPYERRRAAASALVPFRVDSIEAINDARGRIRVHDRLGDEREITIALAPHRPPRIQRYEIGDAMRNPA